MVHLRRGIAGMVAASLLALAGPVIAAPQQAQAAPEDGQSAAGYLSVQFLETDYENIHYGFSEDGLNWKKLNSDQPIVKSNVSDKAIRDPHILRLQETDEDGNNYVILGTDYHAEGSASGRSWGQFGRSQGIVVTKSPDLVNWSAPEIVFAGLDSAGCVWAPEAIWDPETQQYVVYWSGRDSNEGTSTGTTNLRVYKTTTTNFDSFSAAEVWLDQSSTGKDTSGNIIDTHVSVGDDGDYYRFSTSDWATIIDVASSLSGPWTRLVERSNAIVDGKSTTPAFAGQEVRSSEAVGLSRSEGWTGFHSPEGTFIGLADNSGLKSFTIDNLSDLKDGGVFVDGGATFSGRFRHGSVLELTEAERQAVLEAYGPKTPVDPGEPELIAAYDFEDGTAADTTGNGNDLTLAGATIENYGDKGNSPALSLRGGTQHAVFPQGIFDGRDYFTLEMAYKNRESNGNFFTFAIGQDNQRYLFLRTRYQQLYGAITKSSYGSESGATASLPASIQGQWHSLRMTVSPDEIVIYLDGERVARQTTVNTTVSELGSDLIGYLGRSFYSGDAYFNGAMDDIKVWNGINAFPTDVEVVHTDQVLGSRVVTNEDGSKTVDVTMDYWSATGAVDGSRTDLSDVAISYELNEDETLTVAGTDTPADDHRDYSAPVAMTLTRADGTTVDHTVQAYVLHTPMRVPGETDATGVMGKKFFADPNVYTAANGKYYVYATTDGHSGWSGSQIRGFESDDLVTWRDMGVMVDLNDQDLDGTPDKSKLPARTVAWAPGMAYKDGKYYLYFSGGDTRPCNQNGESNVAVSDRPDGGFEIWTGVNEALGTCAGAGRVAVGIDPAVFEDPANPGDFYIAWGQSGIKYAKLNADMATYDASSVFTQGVLEFREGAFIDARKWNDTWTYYFSYSKWDTNEERYRVAYATAASMAGPWTYRGEILTQDDALGIKGTGHHSFTQVTGTDDWYIVHHMFLTDEMRPRLVDQAKNQQIRTGNKRELMVQKISFTEPTPDETAAGAVPLINVIPVVREAVAPEQVPAVALQGIGEGGSAVAGDTLSASFNDTWEGIEFQWLRDGQEIDGATRSEYTVTAADEGTEVSVRAVGRSTSGVLNNAGTAPSQTYPLVSGTAAVEAGPVAGLTVDVTTTTRSVAGKVALVVSVRNPNDVAVTVTVTTPYGAKKNVTIAAGKTSSYAFSTRMTAMPAGQVTVTGTALDEAQTEVNAQVAFEAAAAK